MILQEGTGAGMVSSQAGILCWSALALPGRILAGEGCDSVGVHAACWDCQGHADVPSRYNSSISHGWRPRAGD